jgi:hypothetical protein
MIYKEGGEMEISRYRDKCRVKGVTSFDYNLKTLTKKDIILIGYKEDEKRYVAISPEVPTLLREKEAAYQAETDGKNESPKTTSKRKPPYPKEQREKHMENILHYFQGISSESSFTRKEIYNIAVSLEPTIPLSKTVFNGIVHDLVSGQHLIMKYRGKLAREYRANKPKPVRETEGSLELSDNDISVLKEILTTLDIQAEPLAYLSGLTEKIALRLLDKKITYAGITFSSDMWKKFQVVEKDMREREQKNLHEILRTMVKDYIESEYEKWHIMFNVKEMIASATDPLVLAELQNFLNSRISEVSKI